jgi:hypothetical protein
MTSSPYDSEARYSTKRSIEWVGYKVHLIETCDAARPHLIVNVEPTLATTPDDNMVAIVHPSLAEDDGAWGQGGGAVLGQRLYAVCASRSLHASQKGAPHHWLAVTQPA